MEHNQTYNSELNGRGAPGGGAPQKRRGGFKSILAQFLGQVNIIAIPRIVVLFCGDLTSAAVLSQLVYWSERSTMDGWVAKSYEELAGEIGVGVKAVRTARAKLEKMGVVKTAVKKFGGAPLVHYYVDLDYLSDALYAFAESESLVEGGGHSTAGDEDLEPEEEADLEGGNTGDELHLGQMDLPERANGLVQKGKWICPKGQMDLPVGANPLTKTTTKTTANINIAPENSDEFSGAPREQNPPKSRKKREKNAEPKPERKKPDAVAVFFRLTGKNPPKAWWDELEREIGSTPDNIAFWSQVVHRWIGLGWNPLNVAGMLEYYRKREFPAVSGMAKRREATEPPKTKKSFAEQRAELEAELRAAGVDVEALRRRASGGTSIL